MTDPQIEKEFREDISNIERKRVILEEIVSITSAIEEMQDSLNSVLILGMPSTDFPKETLNLYNALSGNLQHLPVTKIKEYLQNLEIVINKQLKQILKLSDMNFASDEAVEILIISSDESENNVLEMLSDFKRTSQTAVSLRVLLKKRGVTTSGAALSVPMDVISNQLQHLEQEEKQQRNKIRSQILEMKSDIDAMINNPDYPDSMKNMLMQTSNSLQNDLSCLDAGKKLESLSFVSDTQELNDLEYEEIVIEAPADDEQKKEKNNLYELTHKWLNTSWDVSWQDLKK